MIYSFACLGAILEDKECSQLLLILNIPILRSDVMQVVFIYECKSCEHKRRTGYDKYCKVQLLNGTISHGASNEQDAYLEPS